MPASSPLREARPSRWAARWRDWLGAWHRDLGYLFTGVALAYALSGLALNHTDHWDPSFVIERREVSISLPRDPASVDRETVVKALRATGIDDAYRGHDFPSSRKLKVFTQAGSLLVDLERGQGTYEASRRRPVLYRLNWLHLHPRSWWRWFSDAFCVALVVITLSGLVIGRGRHGFRRRGWWLVMSGILAPALLFLFGSR